MKQGISSVLPVHLGIDLNDVSTVEFIFKSKWNGAVKKDTYPSDTAKRRDDTDIIDVEFTAEDTRKFRAGEAFYMDTRITLINSTHNPETPIITLIMNETLFEEGDD